MLLSIGVIELGDPHGLPHLPAVPADRQGRIAADGRPGADLVFVGGAAGKLVCAWIGARIGVVATVWVTEGFTALGILALLPLPLEFGLVLLPLIGVALNGTSSVLYGSVPLMVAPEKRTRAFGVFYTGTIGSGAVAPIFYGLIGDALSVPLALTVVAALVLATLPLVLIIRRQVPPHSYRFVNRGPGIRALCAEILNAPVIHSQRHRMGMTQMSQLSLNEERRRMPRQRTLKSARIVIDAQGPVLDCIVRNLSPAARCCWCRRSRCRTGSTGVFSKPSAPRMQGRVARSRSRRRRDSSNLPPVLRTALSRPDHRRGGALVAEADASALQVVRRHLHDHAVADAGADAELAHLAGRVGEDLVVVVELHAEVSVRQHLGDGAVEFQHFFLGHAFLSKLPRAAIGLGPVRALHECDCPDIIR